MLLAVGGMEYVTLSLAMLLNIIKLLRLAEGSAGLVMVSTGTSALAVSAATAPAVAQASNDQSSIGHWLTAIGLAAAGVWAVLRLVYKIAVEKTKDDIAIKTSQEGIEKLTSLLESKDTLISARISVLEQAVNELKAIKCDNAEQEAQHDNTD